MRTLLKLVFRIHRLLLRRAVAGFLLRQRNVRQAFESLLRAVEHLPLLRRHLLADLDVTFERFWRELSAADVTRNKLAIVG